ncbi:MAG: DUF2254 domain-containing protein [Candidatus Methanoperedens sp.]|nr:DUF2254 domain-containing protein [Candidatus Methanoperedens sp.]
MKINESYKEKLKNWYESYKPILKNWLYGIAFYLIPFIIGYLAFSFVLSDNILHTDVDSARYMLSALIQSEAAIVALVVTLSLVAVQLAAQSYSARVIEVFRKAPDLWILMGIYGIAIFYGLGVLKMIENPQVGRLSNLEGQIAFSYYLGVFAFVALVPYMWKMFEMLKPSTVINMLAIKITKQNILSAIGEETIDKKFLPIIDVENDPILPVIDIVRSALMKYDYETVKDGLRAIGESTVYIFENETIKNNEDEKISKYLFDHLTRVGRLAASKKDEESTFEVTINICKIGIIAAKLKLPDSTWHAAESLGLVGMVAAEQKLINAIRWITFSLEKVGIAATEQNLEATWVAEALGWIGEVTAQQKLKNATVDAVKTLEKVGKIAAKQKLEYTTNISIKSLEKIGMTSGEQGLDYVISKASSALVEVGKAAHAQKFEDDVVTQKVVDVLNEFIKISDERKYKWAKKDTEDYLKNYLKKINEEKPI